MDDKRKEYNKKNQKIFQRRQRIQTILVYGGKCECCGEETLEFLGIDHIGNTGVAHRKTTKTQISNWLRQNGYPKKGFRVLCHNCNMSIGFYGYCPHDSGSKMSREWTNDMQKSFDSSMEKLKKKKGRTV